MQLTAQTSDCDVGSEESLSVIPRLHPADEEDVELGVSGMRHTDDEVSWLWRHHLDERRR